MDRIAERYWAYETLGVSLQCSLYLAMGSLDSSLAKTLVRAIALRRWTSPDFCVLIAGPEDSNAVVGMLARQHAVAEHVRSIELAAADLDRWLCAADAFICLSESPETWNAVRKAQSLSTSILFMTTPRGLENFQRETQAAWAWVLRSDSPSPADSLAELMVRAVENTPERHAIRVHAKHLVSHRSTVPASHLARTESVGTARKVG